MTRAQIAYIAGLLDGEGCIHASHSAKGRKYYTRTALSQANYGFVTGIQELVGLGKLCRGRKLPTGNETLRWQIHKQPEVREFLAMIYPFLILKKPQASIALCLLDDPYNEVLATELKALKKRGLYGMA